VESAHFFHHILVQIFSWALYFQIFISYFFPTEYEMLLKYTKIENNSSGTERNILVWWLLMAHYNLLNVCVRMAQTQLSVALVVL
jgi:hypothetical protein